MKHRVFALAGLFGLACMIPLHADAARKRAIPDLDGRGMPNVQSSTVLVQDQATGKVIFSRNADAILPIASITKLMTAIVVLDSNAPMSEMLEIEHDDIDTVKGSHSRLKVGTHLRREEMLRLALMSSENRAASALSRNFPGGRDAFVAAMNRKAQALGLDDTRFYDPTGLEPRNVSSARDLASLVSVASRYERIREFSTTPGHWVEADGRVLIYKNTNTLVNDDDWQIAVQKTGYIREAGRCLVMQAWVHSKPMIIVLLDSVGRLTRIGDANRIRKWLESGVSIGR